MNGRKLCAHGRARAGILAVLVAAWFAADAAAQTILARIPVPLNPSSSVAVNARLNKIYVTGGTSARQDVFVIDGRSFKAKRVGIGSGVSVDTATDNYWAASVAGGRAIVRRGSDNSEISRVPTTEGCAVSTAFDSRARRAWLTNQCGDNGDIVFVFDGDDFARLAGPIATGGVLEPAVVSSATGRLYIAVSGVSKRVNPETFLVTRNAFGIVKAADPVTGKLFAMSGHMLQIVNAIHDPEVMSVSADLGYTPAGLAVDFVLGHIYLSNPAQSSIEVRTISTAELLTTFSLGEGFIPGSIAVDSTRGRFYVAAAKGEQHFLLAIGNGNIP